MRLNLTRRSLILWKRIIAEEFEILWNISKVGSMLPILSLILFREFIISKGLLIKMNNTVDRSSEFMR